MNWPWHRHKPCPTEEAEDAATHARRVVRDAKNLDRRVEEVTEHSRQIRERNHIAATLTRAIRGDV